MRPAKDRIRDFILFEKRTFTSKNVREDTGIYLKTIQNILKEFENEGVIKLVDLEGRVKRYRRIKKIIYMDYKPSNEIIEMVRGYIDSTLTHDDIANELNVSRSLVSMSFKYLRLTGITRARAPKKQQKIREKKVYHRKPKANKALKADLINQVRMLLYTTPTKPSIPVSYMTYNQLNEEIQRLKIIRERINNELLSKCQI